MDKLLAINEIIELQFKRRLSQIREDIETGKITFYNSPETWTEELLDITSFNYTQITFLEKSRWN